MPEAKFDPREPMLVIAGATSTDPELPMDRYEVYLHAALENFHGVVLSGGTNAGVCGLLAQIVGKHNAADPGRIRLLGYVPEYPPRGLAGAGWVVKRETDDTGTNP